MNRKILKRDEAFAIVNKGDHTLTPQERENIIATIQDGELHLAGDLFTLLLDRHVELNREWLPGYMESCDAKEIMKENHLEPIRKEPLLRITRPSARKLLRSIGITQENRASLFMAARTDMILSREVLDTLFRSNNTWVEGFVHEDFENYK